LKKADIGVAMGITGTDVSKEAADMILTDDNFATIVHSVEEGRTIYNNIRKVVAYLLSCNIGEILLILVSMLIGFTNPPLGAIQLLSINLITDAFPAFALGMEKKDPRVMDAKPRDPHESIVNKKMMVLVAAQSVFLGAACLASYAYGHYFVGNEVTATTMCFVTIVVEELLRAYSSRSNTRLIVKMNPFSNGFLNKSVLASLAFLALAVYVPFMQEIFNTHALPVNLLLISLGFALLAFIGDELAKLFTVHMHE
jgi:Ca2+-transporting ATPase